MVFVNDMNFVTNAYYLVKGFYEEVQIDAPDRYALKSCLMYSDLMINRFRRGVRGFASGSLSNSGYAKAFKGVLGVISMMDLSQQAM